MDRAALAAEARDAGFRLLSLDATPSTNDEALQRAREGDPGKLWILAREQTKGRGRHGRAWASPPGNLYASLLLVEPCDLTDAPQLGFVAGLALYDAIGAVAGLTAPRLTLKWPNDLLLDGAKISGILLEGHRIGTPPRFVVIVGMGLNVGFAPSDTPYPATSLAQAVGPVEVAAVFSALSAAFATRLAQWDKGLGFARLREAWLARAAGRGQRVTVRLPGREVRGTFVGMDSAGRLLLDGEAGRETIDAGDLFFGSLRSA
ncbi:biotin--[acetyl-CoA-carboxylase] ligase [Chelatococcus sp. SYSU_G07232]|uniref:biotin--[biotin carboxyl-carrier protein] ligase n=1 Tax=Chelatococcus albus TaxID=3047466 RepID=A0ABT7ACF4_9HYPH|nr:biotin--[acetyl-CoA-carboxylase] ligase [Chelatococcus sp. SYSU_G07232]MDJ1156760.1 biotin--[acetyl-CoA-carboxylase] ligase [Chelatococcus sp. SYSU_G07232]